jgi:THO complex subunit 7
MDDEAIIRKRLLTQTSVARLNADPPLKKLVRRFGALEGEDGEAQLQQFSRELTLFEFQLSRVDTVCSAKKRESESYAALQAETEQSIERALGDIQALKAELQVARVERRQREDYEELRTQCMQHPGRAHTLAAIAAVKSEIAALEQDSATTAAHVEARVLFLYHTARSHLSAQTRKKQFAALLSSIDELAAALDSEETSGLAVDTT